MSNFNINRLKEGDEKVFRTIVEKWYPRICILIQSFVGNKGVAEELTQDVLLSLWENREKLTINTSLESYLFVLAKHRSIDYIRHRKLEIVDNKNLEAECIRLEVGGELIENNLLEDLLFKEFSVQLEKAIQELPEISRKIFLLSREQNLKNREIADKLGISIKTVEYHISRALSFLSKKIKYFIFF